MGYNGFLYDKIVREGTITATPSTDYAPGYEPSKIKNFWVDYGTRTKYGAGSGWGWFWIGTGNQKIDFNEGGGALVATLATGSYDADTLCTEIKSKMEAAGALTYTVTYSDTTNKFTIAASGTFSLLWNTGANKANSVADTIGFDDSADDTGSASYTADALRIHTHVYRDIESKGSVSIGATACALYGLNVTSSYTVMKLQRYTTSWVTVATFSYDAVNGRAICFFSSVSASKWRIYIADKANPDGYIELGTAILGDYKQLSRTYEYGATCDLDDASRHTFSKDGHLSVVQGRNIELQTVLYEVLDADEAKLEAVFLATRKKYPLVFVEDYPQAKESMKFIIFQGKYGRTYPGNLFKTIKLSWIRLD